MKKLTAFCIFLFCCGFSFSADQRIHSIFGIKLGVPYDGEIGEYPNRELLEYCEKTGRYPPDVLCISRKFKPTRKFLEFGEYSFQLSPKSKICYSVSAQAVCKDALSSCKLVFESITLISGKYGIEFGHSKPLMCNSIHMGDIWKCYINDGDGNLMQTVSISILKEEWSVRIDITDFEALDVKEREIKSAIRLKPEAYWIKTKLDAL